MGSWIVSLEGSPAGETLALVLVLVSAVTHAMFGVIFKGGVDPYINRGAINISYSIMALPVALFVLPMPSAQMWAVLACSFLAHVFYELLQARAYSKGAFTLVYPVARGTGPIATALLAYAVLSEHLEPLQWLGLLVLSGAIFSLALVNLRDLRADRDASRGVAAAVIAAIATGCVAAVFMNIDAHGTRMGTNPLTFVTWFFVLGAFSAPVFAAGALALPRACRAGIAVRARTGLARHRRRRHRAGHLRRDDGGDAAGQARRDRRPAGNLDRVRSRARRHLLRRAAERAAHRADRADRGQRDVRAAGGLS